MTRIRFSVFAKNELNDACGWYERQQAGLRYVLRGDEVWVMTVSHQHRLADYWVDRTHGQ